jgi:hypothetical protein
MLPSAPVRMAIASPNRSDDEIPVPTSSVSTVHVLERALRR